jgi:hypothetical protein
MSATVIDILHELLRVTIAAHTPKEKQGQVPKPRRWPRPGERRAKKPFSWRSLAKQMGG